MFVALESLFEATAICHIMIYKNFSPHSYILVIQDVF
jgi:hypothetical protein